MHEVACRACVVQREKIEELQEEIRQLRQAAAGGEALPLRLGVGLTVREEQIVRLLLSREMLTKAGYTMARAHENWDGDIKVLDVYICKIRIKLALIGLQIETIWGRGYRLSPETKSRILEMDARGIELPAKGAPVPQTFVEAQGAVRAALAAAPAGLSWSALSKTGRLSESKLQQAIAAMINRGECRRVFMTGAANQFIYTLTADAPA